MHITAGAGWDQWRWSEPALTITIFQEISLATGESGEILGKLTAPLW